MENVYEQFFFLKYSGGWSFSEAYNLPIGLRKWFVQRLVKQLELEKEAIRVMKEFAWEHDMPLSGKLFDRIRSRIV